MRWSSGLDSRVRIRVSGDDRCVLRLPGAYLHHRSGIRLGNDALMTPESTFPAPLAPSEPAAGETTGPLTIKTNRGKLTITAKGRIEGLWLICKRELLTNAQVRKFMGGWHRSTLAYQRRKDFPAPVLSFKTGSKERLDLWSRSDVAAWKAEREKGGE